jgi:hypothetical protein
MPKATAAAAKAQPWSLPTIGTRTAAPASTFKSAMIKYTQAATGLNRAQLTHLAKTGAQLSRRRAGQHTEDAIVQRMFPARVQSFQDIFRGATQHVKFLSSGAFAITILVHYPAMPAPVVVKFTETPTTGGCHGRLLCSVLDSRPLHHFEWMGMLSPDRERQLSTVFSEIETQRSSPHFLHTFTTQALAVERKCSLTEIALWAGATPAQMASFQGASRIHTISANVLEFGGVTCKDIIGRVIRHLGDADAVAALRSCLVQVMQAMTVMAARGLRHNDCHTGNVLGALTSSPYLHYETILHGGSAVRAARDVTHLYYRVPTHGVLWRLIDFGMGTSTPEFGPQDHGAMVRTADGGPRWAEAVQIPLLRQMPVEVYDLARFMEAVFLQVAQCGYKVADTIRRDIVNIAAAALEFGKTVPGIMTIRDAQRYHSVPTDTFRTPAKQQRLQEEVAAASRGASDHGCMLHLFVRTAAAFGFGVGANDGDADTFRDTNAYTFEAYADGAR